MTPERLYLCFGALCSSVIALAANNKIHPVEKLGNNCSMKFGNDPTNVIITTRVKNSNAYPHAVLFGGTCGGSIISPNWILTSALCTRLTRGIDVVAGTNDTAQVRGISRRVKRLVIHPRFSVRPHWLDAERYNIKQGAARFDFLLVELKEPLPLDGISMAAIQLNENPAYAPKIRIRYPGFGALVPDVKKVKNRSRQLHVNELQILSENQCGVWEDYYPEDMICAIGRPPNFISTCNRDVGSGLVDGNGILLGILSWAQNDALECRNGRIVYFSKVSRARSWIRKVANV